MCRQCPPAPVQESYQLGQAWDVVLMHVTLCDPRVAAYDVISMDSVSVRGGQ